MIKPTKYPVGPDDMADLFDQAVNQGKQGKQDTLVSGTNIKTINGSSVLGSGDLTISTSASWGGITGTLSNQTDLQSALNGKASTGVITGTGITMSTARILGRSTAGTGAIEEITVGSGLTLSAGTLTASGSGLTIGTTAITSGTIGRILFEGTGNVVQESANLFWDNTNSRLGIGTASPSALLHATGSVTASGAIARGNYMQPTLLAAANNDVMVGLDIAPTFTNGAFTGVTNASIRSTNGTTSYAILSTGGAEEIATEQIAAKFTTSTTAKELAIGLVNLSGKYWKLRSLSDGTFDLRNITDSRTTFSSTSTGNISIWGNTFFNNNSNSITNTGGINGLWLQKAGSYTTSNYSICSDSTATFINAVGGGIFFRNNNSSQALIASTGNFLIATTTDAGFKLDVNGTARVQSGLTISGQTANNYLTIGTGTGNAFFTWSAYFLGVTGVKFRSENLIGDPTGTATTVRASAAIDSRGYLVTDSIGIGTTTNTINASAIAQIDSTTKGFLPPRMTTTQKNAIATPAAGLVVYDTTLNKLCVRTASAWETITSL